VLWRSLDGGPMFDLPVRDRALARAIVGSSLRRRGEIDAILATFLERGLPAKAGTLYPILLSGAAQLLFMSVPPHAAIDLAVRLAQWDPRAKRFDKLVNAVLRRVSEKGQAIVEGFDAPRLNTPEWLWDRWVRNWGQDRTRAIAEAHLIEPPLDITVMSDPDAWAARLEGRVLPGGSVRFLPKGRIEELPGFAEGQWWVQDIAAALPAKMLGDLRGKRVADLCAAPGGKTAQLLLAGSDVVAVDASKDENLERLGLSASMVEADAGAWQPNETFDAVLLDAPCSSTGTIRRHPDIPYVKSEADIAELAALQIRLLDNAARLVKPRGTLLYSTCSLEPEEGEAQVAAFLARTPGWRIDPLRTDEPFGDTDWADASGILRTFPFQLRLDIPAWSGMDGFFATRLMRNV
jgi:16S rRNA (cytosine967-C5)-methyltransferase